MSNEEIYESSLRFIFKQIDIHVEVNKEASKVKGYKNNSNSEENKLMVLD